jgi:hypothetical protein
MSAVIVGSFAWPSFSSVPLIAYTICRATWYSSLVLAVVAVAVGLAQNVFLYRVGCLSNSCAIFVEILSYQVEDGQRIPRWNQVFIWQLAIGLLEWSIYLWLGGLIVFIGGSTRLGHRDQTTEDKAVRVWAEHIVLYSLTLFAQVAGLCLVAFFAGVSLYLFSTLRLWSSLRPYEHLFK